MHIVLLSGGSGKRLWPLSNDIRSKQFIKLFRRSDGYYESMVQRVFRQIASVEPNADITIATSKTQVSAIRNQLGEAVDICIEPCRRDTFPAIALACAFLHDKKGIGYEESITVCPVDPFVENTYYETVKELANLSESGRYKLMLMGVEPTYPSEKYGYIIPRDKEKISCVSEFKEKPDTNAAKQYILRGALWNGGVFSFQLGYLLDKAHALIDFTDYNDLLLKYNNLEKISFDYAIAEKEKNIGVIRYKGEWKDVGTWNMMSEVMDGSVKGNALLDETCKNSNVINELEIPILCMGCKDMVVAASSDGILVSNKERSGYIKPYVEKITGEAMFVEKSWGTYTVIDVQKHSITIKISMKHGTGMSYHFHELREEVWTVVSGNGTVILDGIERPVQCGDVIKIPIGSRHAIYADTDMSIIEVQIGENINKADKTICTL